MTVDMLRIPERCHTVEEALAAAGKMNLTNVAVLSELEDGSLVMLSSDLNFARCNWLLDRAKQLLLGARSS